MENNKSFIRMAVPIFLALFVSWFYCMVWTPLAYIYNTFPGQDNLVMLIATIPGFVTMFGALGASALINKIGMKNVVLIGMLTLLGGGLIVRFFGTSNIWIAIVGSALTGIAAGTGPTCCYTALAKFAPANLRDKVIGWADMATTGGMLVSGMLAGILARGGEWWKAFDLYWIVVPVIILTFFWFPEYKAEETKEETASGKEEKAGIGTIPSFLLALIALRCVAAFFYMGRSLFSSAMIINEYQLGDSALVGLSNSICTGVSVIVTGLVFAWLKVFKGNSILASCLFMFAAQAVLAFVPSVASVFIGPILMSFGLSTFTSGMSTAITMSAKGKITSIVSGLNIAAMFLGEAICGYVSPFLANIIFGTTAPSACMKVCAFGCLIMGFVILPFFRKGYKEAFPENAETK